MQRNPLHAVVMVKISHKQLDPIHTALESLPEVGLVLSITGNAQLVLLVRVQDNIELGTLIRDTILQIDGITETLTYVGLTPVEPKNLRFTNYRERDENPMYSLMLVSVERLRIIRAFEEMQKLNHVGFAMAITGDADVALLVETVDTIELGELVFEIIHEIKGVIDTRTHVGISSFEPQNWFAGSENS